VRACIRGRGKGDYRGLGERDIKGNREGEREREKERRRERKGMVWKKTTFIRQIS
jgi:hypothetical protein